MRSIFFNKTDGFSAWLSATISALINMGFTAWIIYGMGEYGIALFMLIPLLMGLYAVLIYGYKKKISYGESRQVSWMSLGLYTVVLFLLAMEGVICILMALPFGILLTWVGSLIGMAFVKVKKEKSIAGVILFTLMVPFTSFMDKNDQPGITEVVTSITIDAPPEAVWPHLITFPELEAPEELIFKAGIAYPTHASIGGKGAGAVRHCNFTTGSFVEPITAWNEPYLLAFDVKEQPAPLKEISFWDINAPHLHDYFVSKKGQFRLTRLPGNKTLLEGTTWYSHNIKPEFYWKLWSTYIVHKIHERVLKHIQRNAEK